MEVCVGNEDDDDDDVDVVNDDDNNNSDDENLDIGYDASLKIGNTDNAHIS